MWTWINCDSLWAPVPPRSPLLSSLANVGISENAIHKKRSSKYLRYGITHLRLAGGDNKSHKLPYRFSQQPYTGHLSNVVHKSPVWVRCVCQRYYETTLRIGVFTRCLALGRLRVMFPWFYHIFPSLFLGSFYNVYLIFVWGMTEGNNAFNRSWMALVVVCFYHRFSRFVFLLRLTVWSGIGGMDCYSSFLIPNRYNTWRQPIKMLVLFVFVCPYRIEMISLSFQSQPPISIDGTIE